MIKRKRLFAIILISFLSLIIASLVFPGFIEAQCVFIGGSCSVSSCGCTEVANCAGCCIGPYNDNVYCDATGSCEGGKCWGSSWRCPPKSEPDGCSSDCFTPDTPVKTPEGEEEIVNLTEGDEVAVFDPQTGSPSTGLIQKTFQFTRNAYYKIRTKDGRELKVTGTHPLFAVQKASVPLTFWEYLKTESLTKRVIDGLADVVK